MQRRRQPLSARGEEAALGSTIVRSSEQHIRLELLGTGNGTRQAATCELGPYSLSLERAARQTFSRSGVCR